MSNLEMTSLLESLRSNLFNWETYEFNEVKIDTFNLLENRETKVVKNDILMLASTTI